MKKLSLVLSLFLISFVSFSFADSTLDQAISWMNQNGLTKFTNAQDFMANQNLRRDEATKFFVQYAKQVQKSVSDETKTECNRFTDLNKWRSDLADSMKNSCKLGLFQWTNWKFMPTQSLTNAQAITVLMRMIDGKQDETQWHFAQKYFERAKELGIMNGLNLNSTANFDKLATRGEVAILLFNASNLSGVKLNNQDFAYIESQIKMVNQKFKLDSKERQDYINSLYDKNDKEWSKDAEITSMIIRTLEEKNNTVYVNGFKCTILNIESIVWDSRTSDKNNQIVEINLSCKNTTKDTLNAGLSYIIKDTSSKYFYSNDIWLKGVDWYKSWNFFTNIDIKPVFDFTKLVSPLWVVTGRILSEIPKSITKIKFWIAYGQEMWFKITSLFPTILASKNEECLAKSSITETRDCFAIKWWYITEWISEDAFDKVNDELFAQWKDYYKLSISDSNLWHYYCKDTIISQSCVWIRDGVVESETTIYY